MKRYACIQSALAALLFCSPAAAQDIVQNEKTAASNQEIGNAPAGPENNSVNENNGGDSSKKSTAPKRKKRTILNRQFSDREKIKLLLNAHCDFPSKEDLLATSPDAEQHLRDILFDESILLSVRMRAVQALAFFETPKTQEAIERILLHPEKIEHPLVLIQAIRAYSIMAPDKAPAVIKHYLSSNGDFIRFVAITSLKNCPGQGALDVLKERYAVETNRFFKMRLKQAIDNHCKGPGYCH